MRLGLVLALLAVGVALVLLSTLRRERGGAVELAPGRAEPTLGSSEPDVPAPAPPRASTRSAPQADEGDPPSAARAGVVAERSRIDPGGRTRLVLLLRDERGRPVERAQAVLLGAGPPEDPDAEPVTRTANEEGRCVLHPAAEVPLSLRVLARIDQRVLWERELAPFAPGERRELELELPVVLRELVVRVLDEAGELVPSVTLWLAGEGTGESIPIHRGGTKSCGWVGCETVVLRALAPGFVPLHAPAVRVPEDGRPVELVLQRGYELRVDVVDERGLRVAGGNLIARFDSTVTQTAQQPSPGEFELAQLPDCELQLALTLAGKTYERSASSSAGLIELRVPTHGALEVGWHTTPEDSQELRLELAAIGVELEPQTLELGSEQGVSRFEPVLPGSYRVSLQRRPREGKWRTLGAQDVEVGAGTTADVVLAP